MRALRVVVYADILLILNAYVTYALLLVTDLLCREKSTRLRRTAAALLGGGYAFVIFLEGLPRWVLLLTRLLAAAGFVFVAYGKGSRKRFLLLYGGFFLVNFVFAGLMFALWYVCRPERMLLWGSVVYFDVDTLLLVVLTAVCYGVFYALHRLLTLRKPVNTLFRLTVEWNGRSVVCDAFLDSGNALTEPFSGLPVILAEQSVMQPLLTGVDFADPETAAKLHLRQVPCSGVTGAGVLTAFRPDCVRVQSTRGETRRCDVYVALCPTPLCGGDYGALLHPNLMEEMNVIVCEK